MKRIKYLYLDALVNEDKKNTYLDYLIRLFFLLNQRKYLYLEIDLEKIKVKILSNQEKEILVKIIEGYSYKEIAEMLNISTKKVDNVYAKIKRNLKAIKKEL